MRERLWKVRPASVFLAVQRDTQPVFCKTTRRPSLARTLSPHNVHTHALDANGCTTVHIHAFPAAHDLHRKARMPPLPGWEAASTRAPYAIRHAKSGHYSRRRVVKNVVFKRLAKERARQRDGVSCYLTNPSSPYVLQDCLIYSRMHIKEMNIDVCCSVQ